MRLKERVRPYETAGSMLDEIVRFTLANLVGAHHVSSWVPLLLIQDCRDNGDLLTVLRSTNELFARRTAGRVLGPLHCTRMDLMGPDGDRYQLVAFYRVIKDQQ